MSEGRLDSDLPSTGGRIDALGLAAAASSTGLLLHALASAQSVDALAWILCIARELCLILALWATLGLALRRHHGGWRRASTPAAFAVFGLSTWLTLMAQNFFLTTGTAVELDVLSHAWRRLGELGGALASGLTPTFLLRVGLCALAFGVALRSWRSRPGRADTIAPRSLALLALLGWLCAAALPNFGQRSPFARAMWLNAFGHGSDVSYDGPATALAYEQPKAIPPKQRPPNVLLVVLESGRADILDDPQLAPNLHALAGESIRPERAYSTTTHTTKALVGILCGIPPAPEMELTESFPNGIPTACLPSLLNDFGYETSFVQSADGGFEDRFRLVANMGFTNFTAQKELLERSPELEPWGYLAMDDRALAPPVLERLARSDRPQFVTALTSTMHHPYEAVGADGKGSGRPPRELYDDAVRLTDELVGALIDGLRQSGQLEQTVILVVGDHGEAFGEHGRGQHDASPYEETLRTPFLLRMPGGEPGVKPGNWQHIDILPSLIEAVGGRLTSASPGRSLLGSPDLNRPVSTSCWYTGWCATLVRGTQKVIYHYERQPLEVFDLAADPGETRDLAPELDEGTRQALQDEVLAYRAGVEALWSSMRGGQTPKAPDPVQATGPERRAQCYDQCVADSDPEAPGLQPDCTLVETHPSGEPLAIPRCEPDGLPPGAKACWNYRADDQLHPDCRAGGLNLELGVKRTERVRPGAMLDIRCKLSTAPEVDCPKAAADTPPPAG